METVTVPTSSFSSVPRDFCGVLDGQVQRVLQQQMTVLLPPLEVRERMTEEFGSADLPVKVGIPMEGVWYVTSLIPAPLPVSKRHLLSLSFFLGVTGVGRG
jgi:hypothetical protein